MKILSLYINAFGKFRDYALDFKDGFNVVYGLNEAGKSTIHGFIEGMFYGFVDPRHKTRRFFKTIDKYKPKDTSVYGGSIVFETQGKPYRIERTFLKRKANVKLFNEFTGEDITKTLRVHPTSKLPDIAKFLDLPYMLYRNTLSIRELESKTSSEASDVLIQRLQNLKETSTESFSSKKAIAHLKAKYDDIGSIKARTKPYYKSQKALDDLNQEKEHALNLQKESQSIQLSIDALYEEKNTLLNTIHNLESTIKAQENTLKKNTYKTIMDEVDSVKTIVEKNGGTLKDYRMLNRAIKDYEALFKSLYQTRQSLEQSKQKIATYESEMPASESVISEASYQALNDDSKRLETFINQLDDDHLEGIKDAKRSLLDDFNETHSTLLKTKKVGTYSWIITLVMAVVFIAINFLENMVYFPYSFIGLIIPFVLFFTKSRKLTKLSEHIDTLNEKVQEKDKAIKRREQTNKQATQEIETLLNKYQMKDIDSFNQYVIRSEAKVENYKRKVRYERLIHHEKANIKTLNNELLPLLKRFNLTFDASMIETLLAIRKTHETIESYLEGKSLEAFETMIDFNQENVKVDDYEDNLKSLDQLHRDIDSIKRKLFEKETLLKQKASEYRNLSTIDYEISQLEAKLKTYDHYKTVYEKAIHSIEEATGIIEENFAPLLSENIEHYLPKLTGGNYQEIKLRKDLTFKAYAKKTHTLEDSSYFSTGTLDQIYFAVRLGILKTLKKYDAPFFLDDAFVNFDDERLDEVLLILSSLSKHHQIIHFTCQKRDYEHLKTLKIPHQLKTI